MSLNWFCTNAHDKLAKVNLKPLSPAFNCDIAERNLLAKLFARCYVISRLCYVTTLRGTSFLGWVRQQETQLCLQRLGDFCEFVLQMFGDY